MKATAYTINLGGYPMVGVELARAGRTLAAAARAAKAAALFCAAPFVGLAFVVVLPFYGLGAAAWLGVHALWTHYRGALAATRNVALFFAAPFVGLVYVVVFPVVGVGALAWMALRAAARRRAAC